MEPSPSSDPHEQGGPSSNKNVTIALITDCPTLTVHTEKRYKALIDSGAAISLVRYSVYENTADHLKTAIQSTWIHLNTADGSPMTAYEIGYPIPKHYLALMYKRNSHYLMLGTEKETATFRRKVDSLPTPETVNRRQMLLL